MKNRRFFIIITVLVSLMLACNISIGDTPASPTPVVIVVTQLVVADTATPDPQEEQATETPEPLPTEETVKPTSTAATPMVTPLKDPVNCRFGPSIFWEHVSALEVGAFMQVVGKNADGSWWQVLGPKGHCWVGALVTNLSGDASAVPVVATPEAFITDVSLKIKPSSVNAGFACSKPPANPFTLSGIIATNGPLTIKWYVETEQDGRQPEKTLKFDKFGIHPINFSFAPEVWEKGDFWIRIVVTQPKSLVSDVTYQVKCQ